MQPVLERGSIDKPFDVGLIQLSFIPVCSPNTFQSNYAEGLLFINIASLDSGLERERESFVLS